MQKKLAYEMPFQQNNPKDLHKRQATVRQNIAASGDYQLPAPRIHPKEKPPQKYPAIT
jgi:hypothetical protein